MCLIELRSVRVKISGFINSMVSSAGGATV
jgi:hypothetical protein